MKNIVRTKLPTAVVIVISIGIFFFFPTASFFILFLYFANLQRIKHKKFMKDFAVKNRMIFQDKTDHNLFKGRLFNYGHSKGVTNLMSGKYEDYPIKIFNYHYSTGSGKNRHRRHYTVIEIEIYKTQFPYILLKPKVLFAALFSIENKISLEEKYSNKLELYCEEDYEIEVLQIFTTELLDFLVEHGNKFSIEFSGNKIYFYDDLIILKNEQLDELYNIVKKVLEKTGPLLYRLHDDFDALHDSYKK